MSRQRSDGAPRTSSGVARARGSGQWVYAGVALAVVAVLLLTWALGGFEPRPREYEQVGTGSTITTGPYEFVFTSATAQRQPGSSYRKASVKVIISGTGRTTGDETITPSTGAGGMFLAYDRDSRATEDSSGQRVADGGPSGFTPGLPAVPYQVEFTFDEGYRPGPDLAFAVIAQRYADTSLIQTDDSEPGWRNDDHGFRMDVPLTVLPDAKN